MRGGRRSVGLGGDYSQLVSNTRMRYMKIPSQRENKELNVITLTIKTIFYHHMLPTYRCLWGHISET